MNVREKAEQLANRPYFIITRPDETTEGEPIFIAWSPELKGCIAQGETDEEAVRNLIEARIDFIQSLLEDELPVPEPAENATTSTSPLQSVTFKAKFEADDNAIQRLNFDTVHSRRTREEIALSI